MCVCVFSQKVLAKHGAAKISAYVTHGIFPNSSWERFKHDNGGSHASYEPKYCIFQNFNCATGT